MKKALPSDGLPFVKMHGLGNDFIILDDRSDGVTVPGPDGLRAIAHRHKGIGCDQFMVIRPSDNEADIRLDMFNSDGSVAGACGNGTRCVAYLMMAEQGQDSLEIDTVSGRLSAWQASEGLISVNMGLPVLDWQQIPLARQTDTLSVEMVTPELAAQMGDGLSHAVCVNMGNPHAVFFVPDADDVDVEKWGRLFESHPIFPDRANIEFISQQAENKLRMRVYERGAGITMACGSGACAAGVAAIRTDRTGPTVEITLDGGALTIDWQGSEQDPNHPVIMTGPVSYVGQGVISPDFLAASA